MVHIRNLLWLLPCVVAVPALDKRAVNAGPVNGVTYAGTCTYYVHAILNYNEGSVCSDATTAGPFYTATCLDYSGVGLLAVCNGATATAVQTCSSTYTTFVTTSVSYSGLPLLGTYKTITKTTSGLKTICATPTFSAKAIAAATTVPKTSSPVATQPVATTPVAKPPVATPPVATTPVAKPPIATPPIATPPVATTPVAKPPIATPPIATPPVATTPVAKPPIATPPIATPPALSVTKPSTSSKSPDIPGSVTPSLTKAAPIVTAGAINGYSLEWSGLSATADGVGFLRSLVYQTYDIAGCAASCSADDDCAFFNIYQERLGSDNWDYVCVLWTQDKSTATVINSSNGGRPVSNSAGYIKNRDSKVNTLQSPNSRTATTAGTLPISTAPGAPGGQTPMSTAGTPPLSPVPGTANVPVPTRPITAAGSSSGTTTRSTATSQIVPHSTPSHQVTSIPGYDLLWQDQQASPVGEGYITTAVQQTFDENACARSCTLQDDCKFFNIYQEYLGNAQFDYICVLWSQTKSLETVTNINNNGRPISYCAGYIRQSGAPSQTGRASVSSLSQSRTRDTASQATSATTGSSTSSSATTSPTANGSRPTALTPSSVANLGVLQGCYQDFSPQYRILPNKMADVGTVRECLTLCRDAQYSYAGLEYEHECFCGQSIPATQIIQSSCLQYTCRDDASSSCGGDNAIQIYRLGSSQSLPETTPSSGFGAGPSVTTTSSAATIKSPVASPSSTFESVGCYQDYYPNARTLTGYSFTSDQMTPSMCQNVCLSQGFSLSGVEYSTECYCGHTVSQCAVQLSAQSCGMTCSGSSSLCGGENALEIYKVKDYKVVTEGCSAGATPSSPSSPAPTSTVVTVPQIDGYSLNWQDQKAAADGAGYLDSAVYETPDVYACAQKCTSSLTCTFFNFYQEQNNNNKDYVCVLWSINKELSSVTNVTNGGRPISYSVGYAKVQSSANKTQSNSSPQGTQNAFAQPKITKNSPAGNYIGCFSDSIDNRALSTRVNDVGTVEACVEECRGKGYALAGLEYYYQCFCGSSINSIKLSDTVCSVPCNNDSTETCGNGNALQVYEITSSTSTAAVIATTSATAPTMTGSSASSTASSSSSDGTVRPSIANNAPFIGCYSDDVNARALTYQAQDIAGPAACVQACSSMSFALAGVEYGHECWCGQSISNGQQIIDAQQCSQPCDASQTETCGNSNALQVYKIR